MYVRMYVCMYDVHVYVSLSYLLCTDYEKPHRNCQESLCCWKQEYTQNWIYRNVVIYLWA